MFTAAQSSSSGPKPVVRPHAPKRIPLPRRTSAEVPYARTYPSTPALSPTSHYNHREPSTNPFFVADKETPLVTTQRFRNPPSPPTHVRRPTLPVEISLEHAFGNTRPDSGQAQESRPKKERGVPASVTSCTSSRSRLKYPSLERAGLRIGPSDNELASAADGGVEFANSVVSVDCSYCWSRNWSWNRDTPTSTAGLSVSAPVSRNISISEIPLLSGHIGCAVDVLAWRRCSPEG
ncbi:hypothetical protein RHS01_00424 [Rhizoctonia solani]|uniref:Uncharacterized protein n=1 Tax=Rhizoctonia solani TaxID=456999 RepID=A0A8H7M9L2_9AGAM|nr:hypothetical protein RHS01_00424 [Rhizoctonia solani]